MDTPKRDFPWIFILLAYGLAWIFWIPVVLTGKDYQSSALLMLLTLAGVFGPGLTGIILNHRENDKQGRRDFWRRMFDLRRIRPLWFLIGVLIVVVVFMYYLGNLEKTLLK